MRHEHAVSRTQRQRLTLLALAALTGLAACQGSAGDEDQGGSGGSAGKGGSGGKTSGKGGSAGTSAGPSDPASASCDLTSNAVATTMRRLTANEYDNTIADLVGDTSRPASATFAADETAGGFAANNTVTVSQGDVEKLASVARGVAERAITRIGDVLKCGNGQNDEACALAFIDRFGRLAYRRKLTSDERDQLATLYRDKAKTDGHPQGVRLVIEATLQMPQFLYRPVLGTGTSKSGINRLTGEEVASRLAFFLWAAAPDDQLLSAAENGDLDSTDGIKAQADRMVKDAKFNRTLESFAIQWLDLTNEATKDDVAFPSFTTDTWTSARTGVAKFFTHVVNETDAKLATLLGEPVAYVDKNLASLYGLSASGDFQKMSTDGKKRAGILTTPGVLAHLAGTLESSPVKRGVFVRSRLLCQPPPTPPADVPAFPPPTPTSTQRQRLEQHRKQPSCAACHAFFDPLGLAFEHYDAVGAYRDKENNIDIDSSGELTMTDVDGKFSDSNDLIGMLKKSELVADCLTAQFFRFGVGRLEGDGESCVLKNTTKTLFAQGYSLRDAIVKLTTSDVFRFVPVP